MSDAGKREWRFYLIDDTLWSIIRDVVPELLPKLKTLKKEVQS